MFWVWRLDFDVWANRLTHSLWHCLFAVSGEQLPEIRLLTRVWSHPDRPADAHQHQGERWVLLQMLSWNSLVLSDWHTGCHSGGVHPEYCVPQQMSLHVCLTENLEQSVATLCDTGVISSCIPSHGQCTPLRNEFFRCIYVDPRMLCPG